MRFWILLMVFFVSCAQVQKRPKYISFQSNNDSIRVFAENSLACPTHLIIKDLHNNKQNILDFKAFENKYVFTSNKDTLKILKDFEFSMRYGNSKGLKSYDTLYNYSLPFLKGKRYKVIQGQNTNFTHNGPTSAFAIDLRMNVGQTVCAMRDGIVVAVKEDSNKGGRSKKYLPDGNYIMLYHNDGLFTQYFHLKQNGAIVKKGDSIKKGQPIGYSGNTGMSTTPHLHFGVYKATYKRFISIPYILDSIPTERYKKGKFAVHN